MATQYEIIAVEQSKKAAAAKILGEANDQFRKKADRYEGFNRVYTPLDSEGDQLPPESKFLGDEDRVPAKLGYVSEIMSPFWDVVATKELTNQEAIADIQIENGEILFKDVPVGTLLFLEKELKAYRPVLDALPTLDPAEQWAWNDDQKYWVSAEKKTRRTNKRETPLVMYEATTEHPAQVKSTMIEETVGYFALQKFSGCVSVREKASMIKRCDDLINAVVQARTRANETEANQVKIGKQIFDFILAPIENKM